MPVLALARRAPHWSPSAARRRATHIKGALVPGADKVAAYEAHARLEQLLVVERGEQLL